MSWNDTQTEDTCIDHNEWNEMVLAIQHKACIDFTIYDTCDYDNQVFRFTWNVGAETSYIYGHQVADTKLGIFANEGSVSSGALFNADTDWLANSCDLGEAARPDGEAHILAEGSADVVLYTWVSDVKQQLARFRYEVASEEEEEEEGLCAIWSGQHESEHKLTIKANDCDDKANMILYGNDITNLGKIEMNPGDGGFLVNASTTIDGHLNVSGNTLLQGTLLIGCEYEEEEGYPIDFCDWYDVVNGDLHTHANKALLDTYTQTEVDIADAISKEHTHVNKIELDLITDGDHDVRVDNPHGVTAGQAGASPLGHTHLEVDVTDLDHDAQKIKGTTVDATDIANGKVLKYNSTSGNLEYEDDASAGDMLKSTYDTNTNGIVDNSEKLEGSTKLQVQDHVPKAHTHVEADITDLDHYDSTDFDTDFATKSHSDLNDDEASKHRLINDIGNGVTDLWSASKISTELAGKSDTGHTHLEVDITDLDKYTQAQVDALVAAYLPLAGGIMLGDIDVNSNNLDNVATIDNGGSAVQFDDDIDVISGRIDFNSDRGIYINDDETYVGHGAGDNITTGINNTLIGHDAGNANNFSSCIFLGFEAGKNNTVSNRLYINNSDSAFPLIYGEFDNDVVKIGNNSDNFGLIFDVNTAGCGKIYGGDDTGDDLFLYANATDTRPVLALFGASGGYLDCHINSAFSVRNQGATYFTFNANTGCSIGWRDGDATPLKISWVGGTTSTVDLKGMEINAVTNLTMGVNKGISALKLSTKTQNGSGKSYHIDMSGGEDAITAAFKFNQLGSLVATPGTLAVQVPVEWNGTVYYMYLYTTGS